MCSVPFEPGYILVLGSTFETKPILKIGNSGAAVVELQKLLWRWKISLGNFAIDDRVDTKDLLNGQFNEVVKAAVEEFQTAMFLPVNGIVNLLTWQALYAGAPIHMPELRLGSTGITVRALQQALLKTGDSLYNSRIDGVFSSVTEWAVRHFQRRVGISVDGVVSFETWDTLSKVSIAVADRRLPVVRSINLHEVWYVLSETNRDRNLEAAIVRSIGGYAQGARYYYNRVDLNDDGKDEVLVYAISPIVKEACGYPILVFQPERTGYRLVSQIGLGAAPIIVTDRMTCGWKDIVIHSKSAGESNYWFARFDGKRYMGGAHTGRCYQVPANTSISGIAYIADRITPNSGIPMPKFRICPRLK